MGSEQIHNFGHFFFQTVANIVKREFSFIQEFVEALLEWAKEDLFVNLSVKDLIWGYKEPLIAKFIDLLHKFHFNVSLSEDFGIFSTVSWLTFIFEP